MPSTNADFPLKGSQDPISSVVPMSRGPSLQLTNLGGTPVLFRSHQQPLPEGIRQIRRRHLPFASLSAPISGALHQPGHQLMGTQLKAVMDSRLVREAEFTGHHLQRSPVAGPAQPEAMPRRALHRAGALKLLLLKQLQRPMQGILLRQPTAIGRKQGQQGSVRHRSGHPRTVANKDGPS